MSHLRPKNNSENRSDFAVLSRRAAIAALASLTLIGCDPSTKPFADEDMQLFRDVGQIIGQERARIMDNYERDKGDNLCAKTCTPPKDSGIETLIIRGDCSEPCPTERIEGPMKIQIDSKQDVQQAPEPVPIQIRYQDPQPNTRSNIIQIQ